METIIRYTLISIGVLILVFVFWSSLRRRKLQNDPRKNKKAPSFTKVFFDDEDQSDEPIEYESEEEWIEDEPEEGIEEKEDWIDEEDEDDFRKHEEDVEDEAEKHWIEDHDLDEDYSEENAESNVAGEPEHEAKDEIVQIRVLAKPDTNFSGYDLLHTLTANNFHFGDMNIFHYHRDHNPNAEKLFSLASLQKPGDFDLDKIGLFKTKGLVIFMNKKDHQGSADHVEELMQKVARELADDLDGEIT